MKGPHQYRRRTIDEATELAKIRFQAEVSAHFNQEEIEEIRIKGAIGSGSAKKDWVAELGKEPERNLYYEIQVYEPSKECPYISRYFARILVSRDRVGEGVWIKWKPPVPEYDGPWFS
jgi:uncharacterized protein YciU (UPF0263 family)